MVSILVGYRIAQSLFKKRFSSKWAKTKRKAFKRYGRKCDICGSTRKLEVHHTFSKHDHPSKRYTIKWLRVLCEKHHKGFHSFMGGYRVSCTYDDYLLYKENVKSKICFKTDSRSTGIKKMRYYKESKAGIVSLFIIPAFFVAFLYYLKDLS